MLFHYSHLPLGTGPLATVLAGGLAWHFEQDLFWDLHTDTRWPVSARLPSPRDDTFWAGWNPSVDGVCGQLQGTPQSAVVSEREEELWVYLRWREL